ncbi:hypothetical protein [Ramlibacter sp. AN1133]|uniref:hypothetical protein n=1 Tax=Ramlibacter sp. AN1133 TaxID=3133429 RepID=UPI0030BB256B
MRRTPLRFRRFAALVLAALLPLAASAAPWELTLESDRHSDFSSIDDLRDDNAAGYRARFGRNLAYVQEEVRLQRREGAWSLSLLGRSSATLVGNRDAIEALRHSRGLGRDASDRHFDVHAHLRGFAGAGVEVERGFVLEPQWSGALLVQALALTRWREREIRGAADFVGATSTYTFDLRSSELNDRLQFPFQQPQGAAGAGLLFGGDLAWGRGPWSARAALRDVGLLHWRGVPQQDFTLSTSTRAIDAGGFVVFRPLLQGRNTQSGLTRSAPWRAQVSAGWQATERGSLQAGARWFRGFGALPSVGWTQRFGQLETGATWQFHEQRLVLDARWGGWRVYVGADRLDGVHSRVLGVAYSRPLPF